MWKRKLDNFLKLKSSNTCWTVIEWNKTKHSTKKECNFELKKNLERFMKHKFIVSDKVIGHIFFSLHLLSCYLILHLHAGTKLTIKSKKKKGKGGNKKNTRLPQTKLLHASFDLHMRNYLKIDCYFQKISHLRKCRGSHLEVFLGKGVLKICSKFTGEHPCRGEIWIKLESNFIEITLRYGCSPEYSQHIFRAYFSKNLSGWLLLKMKYSPTLSYDGIVNQIQTIKEKQRLTFYQISCNNE